MKKVLALFSFLLVGSFVIAQQGGMDPVAMKARMKERTKPELVASTKLSDEKADKVLDIYIDAQMEAGKLRRDQEMSEDDKKAKIKEINTARDKKLKEIPLTDEEFKSVATFYEELQKKRMQGGGRPQGGGN